MRETFQVGKGQENSSPRGTIQGRSLGKLHLPTDQKGPTSCVFQMLQFQTLATYVILGVALLCWWPPGPAFHANALQEVPGVGPRFDVDRRKTLDGAFFFTEHSDDQVDRCCCILQHCTQFEHVVNVYEPDPGRAGERALRLVAMCM